MALVEVTALLGKFERFSGRNILEIDDGVGYPALGSDDEALEANGFVAVRGANLGILGDREVQFLGHWSGPFDGAGDGSTVVDGDNFIVLRGGKRGDREK